MQYGCYQILLSPNPELKAILEFLCQESNNLTNCGIYYARQLYFKTRKIIGKYDLDREYKTNKHYQILYSQVAQQALTSVAESFKSFKELKKKFNKGELDFHPKVPNYRKKGGYATITYPRQALKIEKDRVRLPLGRMMKTWFGLEEFHLTIPSRLRYEKIKEVRILPRNQCFYAEFVYENIPAKQVLGKKENVLGIDPGLNNWLTCVSNVETSFIVDGKHIKSMNQYYNKRISTLKENKPHGFWSKRLAHITEKRNRQIRDGVNKAAMKVVRHCVENRIGTVVFGWNKQQRQNINLGKKTNQNFVQIPTARLKKRISQLCEDHHITFVETEESYTSKASFLDGDMLPTIGAKPDGWQSSGKRTKRVFETLQGFKINADCNAAANILRKVAVKLGLNLSRISRAILSAPLKIRLWDF